MISLSLSLNAHLPSTALCLDIVGETSMEHCVPFGPHVIGGNVQGVVIAMSALSRMTDHIALNPDEVTVEALVGLAVRMDHNNMAEEVPTGAGRVQSGWLATELKLDWSHRFQTLSYSALVGGLAVHATVVFATTEPALLQLVVRHPSVLFSLRRLAVRLTFSGWCRAIFLHDCVVELKIYLFYKK